MIHHLKSSTPARHQARKGETKDPRIASQKNGDTMETSVVEITLAEAETEEGRMTGRMRGVGTKEKVTEEILTVIDQGNPPGRAIIPVQEVSTHQEATMLRHRQRDLATTRELGETTHQPSQTDQGSHREKVKVMDQETETTRAIDLVRATSVKNEDPEKIPVKGR